MVLSVTVYMLNPMKLEVCASCLYYLHDQTQNVRRYIHVAY